MAPNYDQESKLYANSNLGLSRMIEQEYRKSKPLPWGGLYQGGQGRQEDKEYNVWEKKVYT